MDNSYLVEKLSLEKGAIIKYEIKGNAIYYFPSPFISREDVEIFLFVKKGSTDSQGVNLQVRYYSNLESVDDPFTISYGNAGNEIEIPLECISVPVNSRRRELPVVRFSAFLGLPLFQDLLVSGKIVFGSENVMRELSISCDKSSLLLFLASCFGVESLNEDSRNKLEPIINSEIVKESKKKEAERVADEKKRLALENKQEDQLAKKRIQVSLDNWERDQINKEVKLLVLGVIQIMKTDPSEDLESPNEYCYYTLRRGFFEDVLNNILKKEISLINSDEEFSTEKKKIFASTSFKKKIINYLEEIGIAQSYIPQGEDYVTIRFPKYITAQLANDIIDGKTTYEQIKPKMLVNEYIQKAVLSKSIVSNEYRVYSKDTMSDSLLHREGREVLREKGIISQNIQEVTNWNDDHYGQKYCTLYVTDYKIACDIIDGKKVLPASNNGSKSPNGCYIATAVYGSYDCPEVWTLRRYRDQVLRNSWLGREFIRVYYYLSPKIVRKFGDKAPFISINRRVLDGWVRSLNKKGFENKPYHDQ